MIARYGGVGQLVFDPTTINANAALKNIIKVFGIVFSFWLVVPFAVYLVFMSSLNGAPRSYETSWRRQIQIYGYSLAPFITCTILFVILSPFYRAKWILTLVTVGMTTYYQYKEQIETCKKYLTYSKFVKLAIGLIIMNFMLGILIKGIV